ncbi:GntR family transcriptional regulator [Marinococcus halophilus]
MEVQKLSIEEAVDIFTVREALEGLVAKEAAVRASPEATAEMKEALLHMAEAGERFTSITYGSRFHHLLYEHASPTAVQFLNQLNTRLERYRRLSGYRHPDYTIATPLSEHEKILSAIERKDGPAAEHYMRAHIRRSLASTKETLELHISSF